MKEEFWFNLHTRFQIDDDVASENLLQLLTGEGNPGQPAFFGQVEPVKKVLDATTMPEAQHLLGGLPKRQAGGLMLRSQNSECLSWIKWNAKRPMPWQFFLDYSLLKSPEGRQDLIAFFSKLCTEFPGLAGGGAPLEDWEAKHWRDVVSSGGAKGRQKKGLDFRGNITGIYWLTVFGPAVVAHFGKEKLQALPLHEYIDLGAGGCMLVLRPDPLAPTLADRLAQDRAIAAQIGASYIFDIAEPDRVLEVIPGLEV